MGGGRVRSPSGPSALAVPETYDLTAKTGRLGDVTLPVRPSCRSNCLKISGFQHWFPEIASLRAHDPNFHDAVLFKVYLVEQVGAAHPDRTHQVRDFGLSIEQPDQILRPAP